MTERALSAIEEGAIAKVGPVARVFVQSFGCRASQADGAAIEAALKKRGFTGVQHAADAELVILNTCTVTHSADVDARRTIRNLHRDNPAARVLVTGCYAQRAPEELAALPGVHWVVGNSHKTEIADLVTTGNEEYHGQVLVSEIAPHSAFLSSPVDDVRADRTRPNLKIQDGCSNRCTFCIIPAVRGHSRSARLESVVEQVGELAARYREVVLSGINLGRWGRDLPGQMRLPELLRRLLRETNIGRLRISSVEPMDWSEELLEVIASEDRIAKHVHLPLQSGSDAVLKRMARKYRTRHYASRLEIARRLMPDAAIGADVMTGFPGESEAEFLETVSFIREQPLTYLHVFTFSERPGTRAAEMPGSVPMKQRRERTHVLRELGEQKNAGLRRRMCGKMLPSLTLEEKGMALTTNFLKVRMRESRPPNELVELEIGTNTESGLAEKVLLPILS